MKKKLILSLKVIIFRHKKCTIRYNEEDTKVGSLVLFVFLKMVFCWKQYGFVWRWNHGCKNHTSNAVDGLEIAITNLQDYYNGNKFPKYPTIIMIIIILHYHLLYLYPFGLYKSLVSLVTLVWDSSIRWMYHHKTFTKKFP